MIEIQIMDYSKYLQRIKLTEEITLDLTSLKKLQEHHLYAIPFENLDIHYGNKIELDIDRTYTKVIEQNRGGFCYELNTLFHYLLSYMGFNPKLIGATVYNKELQQYTEELGHLALVVEVDKRHYLADVGFGEFALHPLMIDCTGPQTDPRGTFQIDRLQEQYQVSTLINDSFVPCYRFEFIERKLEEFESMCHFQQTSPESIFTKQKLITRPTPNGRITLTSSSLKITKGNKVLQEEAINDELFDQYLIK